MILCLTTSGNTGYNGDPLENMLDDLPHSMSIGRAYPNPFNSYIKIPIAINNSVLIDYTIYDMKGRVVKVVNNGYASGVSSIEWNGRDQNGIPVPSGTYFFKFNDIDNAPIQKILYLK
jgi:hypothetical protein